MQTIHLEPSQVPAALRGAYDGRKFKAVVCESMTIPATAGLWDNGSRETYQGLLLDTGKRFPLMMETEAPWSSRQEIEVKLNGNNVIVKHVISCGHDMGLTFYIHPANTAQLLPAPSAALSDLEKMILEATRSLKSSYMGRDRYQMKFEDHRYTPDGERGIPFPTRGEWEQAKADLYGKGYLNKAGAITVKGRNAVG